MKRRRYRIPPPPASAGYIVGEKITLSPADDRVPQPVAPTVELTPVGSSNAVFEFTPAEDRVRRSAQTPASDRVNKLGSKDGAVVELVAEPVSTGDTPHPAPPPPKCTRVSTEIEEVQPRQSGNVVLFAIGLILFFSLLATGVYIFFFKPGTDTTPTTEPAQTLPTTKTP